MNEIFGLTRSVLESRYALIAPEGVPASHVPGWEKADCRVVVSPAMGARFAQLLVTLEREGQCFGNTGVNQYFIYVLAGQASVLVEGRKHRLEEGSFAYLPVGIDVQIKSGAADSRLLIFQKQYQPLPELAQPPGFTGHLREVKAEPLPANADVRKQALLPGAPNFDLAVNVLTFPPGSTLSTVETHAMEHGILFLEGQGVCRLAGNWHPVQAGDALWLAPFCPHWFVAAGKTPARVICYQDANREPA
jgi:(S)-ureidoglycine aminohydrolase